MKKKKVSKKGVRRTGDMLMDFLLIAGVLPRNYFSSYHLELPPRAVKACRRLIAWLYANPDAWLEVPPSMADACCLLVDGEEVPVNRLDRLPGVEDYPWHKRGPMWYCSDAQINLMYSGPLIILRDGWVGVDPRDRSQLTFFSWSEFYDFSWPGALPDGDGQEWDDVLVLAPTLVWTVEGLTWNELTLELVAALLPRLLQANNRPGAGLITPPIVQWSPELIRSIMAPDKGVK